MEHYLVTDTWHCRHCADRRMTERKKGKRNSAAVMAILIAAILLAASLSYAPVNPEADTDMVDIHTVSDLRGLEVLEDVEPRYMTEEEFRQKLEEGFDYAVIEENEKQLESLFLWDPNSNLTETYLAAYSSMVLGYYDIEEKEMVIIEGAASSLADNITMAHEYTHALQDQHFNLYEFRDAETTDGSLASDAVLEGDATLVTYQYMATLPDADITEYLFSMTQDMSENPFPYAIGQLMEFPYLYGLYFVIDIYGNGGWYEVNKLFENPPISTEQIMHPEKYHQGEMPAEVSYPSVQGMELTIEDTLGEFIIFLMLDNYLSETASEWAAEGWGGDTYYYYEDGDEYLSILTIEWDLELDAEEFVKAYSDFMKKSAQAEAVSQGRLVLIHEGTNTTIFYSSNADLIPET